MALYNLKGEGGQSQKLNLRNHGCHLPLAGGSAPVPVSGLIVALLWPCPSPASVGLEGAGARAAAALAEPPSSTGVGVSP